MMKLLFNYGGDQCDTISNDGGSVALESDDDKTQIVSGGRHTRLRTESSASTKRIAYTDTHNRQYKYLVITRADWGLTENGQNLYSYRNGSSSTLHLNPIQVSGLMGPYAQDYAVEAWDGSNSKGYGVEYEQVSGDERMAINKMYVCLDQDLGCEPTFQSSWEMLAENNRYFTPLRSNVRLRTEARMKMRWQNVSKSDYESLVNWPHLERWPFFLFDSDGDVFPWKLEHVVLENMAITIGRNATRTVEMILRRLEHYE